MDITPTMKSVNPTTIATDHIIVRDEFVFSLPVSSGRISFFIAIPLSQILFLKTCQVYVASSHLLSRAVQGCDGEGEKFDVEPAVYGLHESAFLLAPFFWMTHRFFRICFVQMARAH